MIIRSMNNQKEFPEGTTVRNCLKALDAFPRGTLAALSGGIVIELNDPLRRD
jgi:uridine kinase